MIQLNLNTFLNSIAYAVLGVAIFIGSFAILDKMTPYSLWAEIVEKQNTALAILIGLMSLGLGVIIAASIH
jgi:putative membrane protein